MHCIAAYGLRTGPACCRHVLMKQSARSALAFLPEHIFYPDMNAHTTVLSPLPTAWTRTAAATREKGKRQKEKQDKGKQVKKRLMQPEDTRTTAREQSVTKLLHVRQAANPNITTTGSI